MSRLTRPTPAPQRHVPFWGPSVKGTATFVWILALSLFAALLLVLHSSVLAWPFISDDYIFLQGTRRGGLDDLFLSFQFAQNYFRPLGREIYFFFTSWLLDHNPIGFRLLNLCLILATVALLVRLTQELYSLRAGVIAGAIYSLLYTLRLELAWISCSQDVLASLLGLSSVVLYLGGRAMLAAGVYFCGLFAKESIAAIPIVLTVWDVLGRTGEGKVGDSVRRALARTRELWVATGAWAVLVLLIRATKRAWVGGDAVPVADVTLQPGSLWEGMRSALSAYVYLDQPWPYLRSAAQGLNTPWLAVGIGGLVGLLAYSVNGGGPREPTEIRDRKRSALWLGGSWALLGTLPVALAGHHFSAYYVSFAALGFALWLSVLLARLPAVIGVGWLMVAPVLNVVANRVESFRITRLHQELPGVSYVTVSRLAHEVRFLRALHGALAESPPPRGAVIYLSNAPRMLSFATAGSRAPRVWFNDPNLELTYISRYRPELFERPRVFLRFDFDRWAFVRLPDSLVDAIVQGEEALASGQASLAREALERALRLTRAGAYDFERIELLNTMGVAARRSGDGARAKAVWLEVLRLQPTHRGALLNLAGLEARDRRFAVARDLVERVLQSDPNDALALLYLARIERALGQQGAARRTWDRLGRANPGFADSIARREAPY